MYVVVFLQATAPHATLEVSANWLQQLASYHGTEHPCLRAGPQSVSQPWLSELDTCQLPSPRGLDR